MGPSLLKPNKAQSGSGLRWTQRRLILAALPLLLLAATYVAATIDIRNHDGRVLRDVTLGEVDVGGMDSDELNQELDRVSAIVETAPVYIETPDVAYQIDAERLGLTLDRTKTRAAVLAAGREGSGVVRPFRWFGALFSDRKVDAVVQLDNAAAEAGLAAVSKTISRQPGEPTLVLRNGRLELEPGAPGTILDVEQLRDDISESLPSEPGQEIFVDAVTTDGNSIDVDIQSLVDRINGSTTTPIELVIGDRTVIVPPSEFRGWVELELSGPEPQARMNTASMYRWVNQQASIAEAEIDTRSLVVTGSQIRLPSSNAVMCCGAEAGNDILLAVLASQTRIDADLLDDDFTPLVNLGISELIGEFTTRHPSGEDRVINIQRMADIVRGAVIEPGESFSLNGYVGERTRDKGFVAAGVIYDGVFAQDVGGGVSQFATTLFNAAFFGGLDIDAYQAHSIYIDRYPYGREATVNWPGVDLRVSNPTEFPVLIWTEYTPDSITVKLFGTATVVGEQTGQTTEAVGECTRVRTERTRTWVDGQIEIDTVGATYQPSEGFGCDGLPTIPPPVCEEDEGLLDTTNNGFGDSCVPLDVICPEGTVAVDDNGDRLIDACDARECPADTDATDTDGDGRVDRCLPREPETDPDPATEPEPEPSATAEPAPTLQPEPEAGLEPEPESTDS